MSRLLRVESVTKICPPAHARQSLIRQCWSWISASAPAPRRRLLEGISFEVHAGEMLGVIGRNGAGKSTLLKILAGILAPNSGTVERGGTVIPMLNYGAGLLDDLDAVDNVYFYGGLVGITGREVARQLDKILEFAELRHAARQKVRTFSAGMRARLAFAVVMRAPGEILLLDEVFAVGDYPFQQKCLRELDELRRSGRAIVYVSHDMSSVAQHADRCLHLIDGRLAALGAPEPIIASYLQSS